jgi:DNA modification methylase
LCGLKFELTPVERPKKRGEFSQINYAIVPELHTAIYNMHKYWARKPHNVVAEYVKNYSNEGDTVLDPFCGSGVTFIEALRYRRKAIAIDLDPVSTFITRTTVIPIDLEQFQRNFDIIKSSIKPQIDALYLTTCPNCKEKSPFHHIIFDNTNPITIHLTCPKCGFNSDKEFTTEDKELADEIEGMDIPYWYPTNELIWNTRVNVSKGMKVSDLFSKRNLLALSIILNEIEKIEDNDIKDVMKLAFSSTLPQASKLLVYAKGSGPSWKVRGYWTPRLRWEMYVWQFFENRFNKVKNGKEESNNEIGAFFKEGETAWIFTQSATDMGNIPDSSIDYVFTDPPYGDSVPYLELNYVYASWLKFPVNFDDEIIISDSPVRPDKNSDMYYKLLSKAFREIYRVLKPDKYMTLTFHNTNIQIYNAIIKAIILASFDLEKVVYQPPAVVSPKAQLAPYASAEGDYYIRCKKVKKETLGLGAYAEMDAERYEKIIVETVKKLIAENGEPIPYSIILNNYPMIYHELNKNGYLFSAPEGINEILERHLGKEFVLVEVKDESGEIIGNKWWTTAVQFLDRVPLSERVEAVTVDVLNRNITVSYDDVLRQVYLHFTNSLIPDTQSVLEALEEYAERTSDGKWRLKPSIKRRESAHDSVVEALAVIGRSLGFEVYADLPSWRDKLDIGLPLDKLSRVREIDVLWYRGNEITHEFEVENTTGITEAIVRGSNISTMTTKRYVVIPEERQDFFNRKISEPMLKQKIEEYGWKFIFYDSLMTLFEKSKKTPVELEEIEGIAGTPKPDKIQQPLQGFLKP